MKKLIQAVPIPLAGVMLGCAALGNLLQSRAEALRSAFGIIAGAILLLLLLKLILFFPDVKKDLQNPILASVAATFPMGVMLLSVYAKPFLGTAAQVIWYAAIALHVALIVYFTVKFIVKLDLSKVFASCFIVYVGIAAASITAPAYEAAWLGEILFWFAFASLLLLLALVGYRYLKLKAVPEPAQPLFCIFAAPASLCLAGYIQSAAQKLPWLLILQIALSLGLYLLVLVNLPRLLKLKFYPSYAAFTFPFVISAIAVRQATAVLAKLGTPAPWLGYVAIAQEIIAAALVVYALVRFILFLAQAARAKAEAKA